MPAERRLDAVAMAGFRQVKGCKDMPALVADDVRLGLGESSEGCVIVNRARR